MAVLQSKNSTPPSNATPPRANLNEILPRELCELAFESLPIALVVFDRKLNVLFRNRAAQLLLGEDNNLTAALERLAVESRYEDWATEIRRVLETLVPRRIDVTLQQAKDQPELFLNLLINPLRLPNQAAAEGGILLAEDVTATIGMQRRLAVSERLAAVGKLAARVAHELNNPLDGILRYTNLAARQAAQNGDTKTAEYLEQVKAGILRMSDIAGDLHEFSRSTPATFEQATINKILEDALTTMEGRATDSGITVVCNFHDADTPVVRGSNLFQIFCNLIKNAIDAMPEGGTLTLGSDIVGDDVVVTVTDTGIGLPPDQSRIFDAFFTTKPPGKGTGLGLAVCKDLIERYGGTIAAGPNQPQGTVLTVRVPIRACAAGAPVRSGPRES